jgi:hypothetical protein
VTALPAARLSPPLFVGVVGEDEKDRPVSTCSPIVTSTSATETPPGAAVWCSIFIASTIGNDAFDRSPAAPATNRRRVSTGRPPSTLRGVWTYK